MKVTPEEGNILSASPIFFLLQQRMTLISLSWTLIYILLLFKIENPYLFFIFIFILIKNFNP